jgi:hypothetical protein
MTCQVLLVPTNRVGQIWDRVGPLLARAMTKLQIGDCGTLAQQLRDAQALLWIAVDGQELKAALATQVSIVDGRKYCTLVALGGRHRRDWLPMLGKIEDYARAEGCIAMRIYGRPGWSRVLPDYKIIGHITERKLTCPQPIAH